MQLTVLVRDQEFDGETRLTGRRPYASPERRYRTSLPIVGTIETPEVCVGCVPDDGGPYPLLPAAVVRHLLPRLPVHDRAAPVTDPEGFARRVAHAESLPPLSLPPRAFELADDAGATELALAVGQLLQELALTHADASRLAWLRAANPEWSLSEVEAIEPIVSCFAPDGIGARLDAEHAARVKAEEDARLAEEKRLAEENAPNTLTLDELGWIAISDSSLPTYYSFDTAHYILPMGVRVYVYLPSRHVPARPGELSATRSVLPGDTVPPLTVGQVRALRPVEVLPWDLLVGRKDGKPPARFFDLRTPEGRWREGCFRERYTELLEECAVVGTDCVNDRMRVILAAGVIGYELSPGVTIDTMLEIVRPAWRPMHERHRFPWDEATLTSMARDIRSKGGPFEPGELATPMPESFVDKCKRVLLGDPWKAPISTLVAGRTWVRGEEIATVLCEGGHLVGALGNDEYGRIARLMKGLGFSKGTVRDGGSEFRAWKVSK